VRSVDELERLAPEWARLSARHQTPLLDPDWFACAAAAFHRDTDLRIVTVRTNGALTAIAPMTVGKIHRHLVLIGTPVLHEPSGWIYADLAALQTLAKAVAGVGDVVVLDRLDANSRLGETLSRSLRWQAVTVTRQTSRSYVVATNRPWETYLATLSARTRKKLAGVEDKAAREFGEVRFVRMDPTPDQAQVALELLVRIEADGWKGRQGSSLSARPELLHFFRTYLVRAASQGRMRLSVLWFGDVMAAAEIGVEAYGRMWGLKLAYDERFSKYAPAVQLVHGSIAASAHAGLEAYEFLGSAEPWQLRWRPSAKDYQLAAVYPLSGRAMAAAMLDAKSYLSKRLQRRVSPDAVVA